MKKNQKNSSTLVVQLVLLFGCCIMLATGRHHHHKRTLTSQQEECFYQNSNKDHHTTLAQWLQKKNSSNYSPYMPHGQELFELEAEDFRDGVQLTSGISCHKKVKKVSVDMPLNEKSLCPFEYVLNYNPKRVPASLTEVKCSCRKPSSSIMRSHIADCQPQYYDIRVLLFDEECNSYKEHVETLAMACIPVLRALNGVDSDPYFMTAIKAEVPT